jgi:hypothetical protein
MINEQKDDRHSAQPLLQQAYVSSRRSCLDVGFNCAKGFLEASASRKGMDGWPCVSLLRAIHAVCRLKCE